MGEAKPRERRSPYSQGIVPDVDSPSSGTGGGIGANRRVCLYALVMGSGSGPEGSRPPINNQCSEGRGDEEGTMYSNYRGFVNSLVSYWVFTMSG